jgi:transcriptional regulator with XRE-family HTH domain
MSRIKKSDVHLSIPVEQVLKQLGRDIDLARKKRRMTIRDLAMRMMVSPTTVIKLIKGDPGVNLGALITVLWVFGLHKKLNELLSPENDSIGLSEDLKRVAQRVRKQKTTRKDIDF